MLKSKLFIKSFLILGLFFSRLNSKKMFCCCYKDTDNCPSAYSGEDCTGATN